jgi:Ca-activated chloride channel family protein
MLANDEATSRLDRARRLSIDLMDSLVDNRIGIIAFAGSNVGVMPLTSDKVALEAFIDSLDVQLASNNSGTSIEKAIEQATESLKTAGKDLRLLVLISDGEEQTDDPESSVKASAQKAAENGIIILSVGIGSLKGSKIPLEAIGKPGFKLDQDGKEVITKLQENLLQLAADTTAGIYLHTQPDGSEVKEITKFVEKFGKGEVQSLAIEDREEKYQYFLALAILLIVIDLFLMPFVLKNLVRD